MVSKHHITVGIQAGLLAGASIVVLFFLLDLVRFQPLASPLALGGRLFGPSGPALDTPVLSQLVSITMFAGSLLTLTILHFLAFSLLGVSAVWWCEECGIRLNLATGALYGIMAGSFVFYSCLALASDHVLANFPGPWTVALANLTAGAVMGGFVQFTHSRSS
jgi:hypothetical protein